MVKYYVVEGKSCCLNGQVIKDSIEVAEEKSAAFEAAVKMGLLSKEKGKKAEEPKKEEKKEEVVAQEAPAEATENKSAKSTAKRSRKKK